ncbi:lytic transglycosylase domain-containing protein [Methylocapsa sp. S129]|uniref:lytic murein transglycosylase n=1 Tax=Methylocapsa sp. S129 TaxID=1641869 RepID=UPI00131CEAC8|nr:lytic murein transglycosylase [Methylocapsa sp. S129]
MTPLRTAALAGAAAIMLGGAPARAAQCGDNGDGFDAWLASFKQEARSQGISPSAIESALADVSYDESVISHDRGQRAFHQSLEQFSARRVTAYSVKKGKSLLQRYAGPLHRIEQRYGVPGSVLVAIWGLETSFGAGSGNFQSFSALATLAYDCRRSERFHAELLDALRIVQRGDLQPSEMRGAWAGEIGQTQFMPSSYLKYAVGIDGGAGDLINNPADALASTANFLHANGWRGGAGWDEGQPNFAALLEWNKAPVYAKTIALFADRLAAAAGNDNDQ